MNTRGVKIDFRSLITDSFDQAVEDKYPRFKQKEVGKSPRKTGKKSNKKKIDKTIQSSNLCMVRNDPNLSQDNPDYNCFSNLSRSAKMASSVQSSKNDDPEGSDNAIKSVGKNVPIEKAAIVEVSPVKEKPSSILSSQDAVSWHSDDLLDLSDDEKESRDKLLEKLAFRDRLKKKQENLKKDIEKMSRVDNEIESLTSEINKLRKRKSGTSKYKVKKSEILDVVDSESESEISSQNSKLGLLLDLLRQTSQPRKAKVKAKQKLAQHSSSESTGSESNSDSFEEMTPTKKRQKKGKKSKRMKSGIHEKSVSSNISRKLKWAPALLEAGNDTDFDDLTFQQYVFGEAGIMGRRGISREELLTRLYLMKRLAKNESKLGFKKSKEMYRQTILSIEKKELDWADFSEIDRIENDMKFMHMKLDSDKSPKEKSTANTKKESSKNDDLIWCNDYNKGSCQHSVDHTGYFRNKQVKKVHICRVCWTMDKEKKKHTESDAVCPHKSD
jgi:hypothetical protein